MFNERSFFNRLKRKVLKVAAAGASPLLDTASRQFMMDYPLQLAFETASGNQLDGDYYEFGVWKGRSFILAHRWAKSIFETDIYNRMKFVAFDSFEGLPDSQESHVPKQYHKGAFSASRNLFEQNCARGGVPAEKLISVPGFFSELHENRPEARELSRPIAIAYIDCDLFEGARDALNFMTRRLQVGSLIVFDDWNRHHASERFGIRRACAEWLKANPQLRLNHILTTKRALFAVDIMPV